MRQLLTHVLACSLLWACAGISTADDLRYRGANHVVWWHDSYGTPQSDTALADLAFTGANCMALVVTQYMETYQSNSIAPDPQKTPTDASLAHAIERAHDLGMTVMLKPHVDCRDGKSRTEIDPSNLELWQKSYAAFLEHCAQLAQANGVGLLCIGTELTSMSLPQHDEFWRDLIAHTVAPSFGGQTVYAANWDAYDALTFWDALDYAGVDGYFRLPEDVCPTREGLRQKWAEEIAALRDWQAAHGRPVLITEIGYYSVEGCAARPNENPPPGALYGECCQTNAYAAALDVLAAEPWVAGILFWDWQPYAAHPEVRVIALTPQDKPAQDEMSLAFGGPPPPPGTDHSLFSFERSALRWVPETRFGSRGIADLRPTRHRACAGAGSLELLCDLKGGRGERPQGEAFVDLRYLGFGTGDPNDKVFDLLNQQVTCAVWCPAGARGWAHAPNGLQVFVKNPAGESLYGSWTNICENEWMKLSLTITDTPPPGGYMSAGFDPRRVTMVGLKIGVNTSSMAEYRGPIFLDALNVGGLCHAGDIACFIRAWRDSKATGTIADWADINDDGKLDHQDAEWVVGHHLAP